MITHQYISLPKTTINNIQTSKNNSLASYTCKFSNNINKWFKAISVDQRANRLIIKNKKLVTQLISTADMLQFAQKLKAIDIKKLSNRNSQQFQSKVLKSLQIQQAIRVEFLMCSSQLIKNIVIISKDQIYQSIGFSEQMLTDIQRFIALLDKMDYYLFFRSLQQFSIDESTNIDQHRKLTQIATKLHGLIKDHIENPIDLEINKIKFKMNKIWREMSVEKKIEMTKFDNYNQIISEIKQLSIDLRLYQLPTQNQIQQYLQKLKLFQKNQIYEFLTQSTLEETCYTINTIKWIIFTKLKKFINQINHHNLKKKNNKRKKTDTLEMQVLDINQSKQITKKVSIKNKLLKENHIKQLIIPHNQIEIKQKIKYKHQNTFSQQIENKRKNNNMSFHQYNQRKRLIQQIYFQKLKNDLIQVTDNISQIANSFSSYRIIAYNRIQYLLNIWNIPLKIFGSCATGLALPNSDVDLAVDSSILNFYCHSLVPIKDQVCAALGGVYQLLENKPWVSNPKFIKTAAIPVLKFQVNPLIPFELYSKDPYLNILNTKKEKQKKIMVKVDLTIELTLNDNYQDSSNHLGIITTNQMNEWMTIYPSLRILTLVMKYLLNKKQLNNVYKGGLSSYCVMIMGIAYLHHKNIINDKNSSKIFYGFIDFYTQNFKHDLIGIDIRKDNKSFPFFDIQNNEHLGKIQVKDPLNSKIISLNSYQYSRILQELKKVKQSKNLIQKELNKYLANPTLNIPERSKIFSKNYIQEYLNQQPLVEI